MSDSLWPPGLQHPRLPCSSPSPRVHPSSCLLNQWCYPTILSFATLFFFCLQSFSSSGSFPVNQLFASGGQSIGTSALVLPMNIQGWFPLGWTGWLSLQSKGLSRVFSSTTVWKHQFISIQPSLWSNSHICIQLPERPWLSLWVFVSHFILPSFSPLGVHTFLLYVCVSVYVLQICSSLPFL